MAEKESLRDWMKRDRGQIALVFTDIVSSTKLANGMGDNDWIDALTEHFKKARLYKQKHDGFEVKLIGDACMVAFHTAWPAVQFALDFSADTGHSLIKITAGVHVGEIRVVEDDMYGIMVNYTSRVIKAASGRRGPVNVVVCAATLQHVRNELGFKAERDLNIIPLRHTALDEFDASQRQLYRITRKLKVPEEPSTIPSPRPIPVRPSRPWPKPE